MLSKRECCCSSSPHCSVTICAEVCAGTAVGAIVTILRGNVVVATGTLGTGSCVTLDIVNPGCYVVTITKTGYYTVSKAQYLSCNQTYTFDLTLSGGMICACSAFCPDGLPNAGVLNDGLGEIPVRWGGILGAGYEGCAMRPATGPYHDCLPECSAHDGSVQVPVWYSLGCDETGHWSVVTYLAVTCCADYIGFESGNDCSLGVLNFFEWEIGASQTDSYSCSPLSISIDITFDPDPPDGFGGKCIWGNGGTWTFTADPEPVVLPPDPGDSLPFPCDPIVVKGCNDMPLEGATVVYKNAAGTVLETGTTSTDGTFVPSFVGVPSSITVSKDRFVTQIITNPLVSCCLAVTVTLVPATGYACFAGCADPIATTLHAVHPLFGARTFYYSPGALLGPGWYMPPFHYAYPGCDGCTAGHINVEGYLLADGTYHDTWDDEVGGDCPITDELPPNLISNPSFETGDFTDWTLDFASDDACWIGIVNKVPCGAGTLNPQCNFDLPTITDPPPGFPYPPFPESGCSLRHDPSGEVIGPSIGPQPDDGAYQAYFMNASVGSISQTFATEPGVSYSIGYALMERLGEGANWITVTWDDTVILQQAGSLEFFQYFNPQLYPSAVGTHGITVEVHDIVATGTTSTLKFTMYSPWDQYLLDHVSVLKNRVVETATANWSSPGPTCGASWTIEFELTPSPGDEQKFYCTSSTLSFYFTE